tara:strand:- start:582 stop:896 length:315 start_codon:yes stop_codon:yes gene_type:complete
MKTPVYALTISVVILVFSWLTIERANADGLFDGPGIFDVTPAESDTNFLWEGDGSLTIVKGAENSGYVIKDGEVETFVIPKSDGSNTFIYGDGLTICNSSMGCY